MNVLTTKPWPPPPDLESIQDLMRVADIEGFIEIHEAPVDEYDIEAKSFYVAIEGCSTKQITAGRMLPMLMDIWSKSFSLDASALEQRRPALLEFAEQVERFFGPEAKPQVRQLGSQ